MSTLHRQQLLSAAGGVNDQSRVYCNDNDAVSCQRDGANRLNPHIRRMQEGPLSGATLYWITVTAQQSASV